MTYKIQRSFEFSLTSEEVAQAFVALSPPLRAYVVGRVSEIGGGSDLEVGSKMVSAAVRDTSAEAHRAAATDRDKLSAELHRLRDSHDRQSREILDLQQKLADARSNALADALSAVEALPSGSTAYDAANVLRRLK